MASLAQIAGRYFMQLVGLQSAGTVWVTGGSYSSFHGIGGIFLIGAGSLVVGVIVMVVTARFLPRYFAKGITTPVRDERSTTP